MHERTQEKKRRRPSRDPKIDRLIEQAANDAGTGKGSTARFVKQLDCNGAPAPEGYKTWHDASKADPKGNKMRGVKDRAIRRILDRQRLAKKA